MLDQQVTCQPFTVLISLILLLKIYWPSLTFDNKSLKKCWNLCLIIKIITIASFFWYEFFLSVELFVL